MTEGFRRTWPRRVGAAVLTVLALLLVWAVLTAPDLTDGLHPGGFVVLPVELLVGAALVLALPATPRRVLVAVAGVLLGVVGVLRVLDLGFFEALYRPFDPVIDWSYLDSAVGLVDDSLGRTAAVAAVALAVLATVAMLVLTPLAVRRLSRILVRHRRVSWRVLAALAVVWAVCAAFSLQYSDGSRVASTSTATYAVGEVTRIPSTLHDQQAFARAARRDPLRDVPAERLLRGLRGKDVLFVFVESYGRVAVQDSSFAPGVDRVLDRGTRQLDAAGFGTRSAFMESPTFGAISWLAHSTLQSGLWVDSQQRYDVLVDGPRLTLSQAFGKAGWRTVGDVPANTRDWPQGEFYHYDHIYDSRNVGYRGPRFGYPTMPDQYTLDAFQRLELAKTHRRPVMAEIDLISSHAPWSRTPHMIDQAAVGDGSVFEGMPEQAPSKTEIWTSPDRVRAAYGESIEYSLTALTAFLKDYATKDTVVVFLGDHQPSPVVSGTGANHDVPVSVVAKDPAVLRRIDAWGWEPGLHPSPRAPVWRMDAFRDRFLATFAR
ncbi:MAG: sulfatase-like hydrolase/transferase [Nocardioidaceae bacterium]|nr:sulfatase-like hydrolase/transferase [Nocardioidaceae bacterium]NUS51506.1 sulfatase-like hydrolase/transferase [Nocardioidaceae bacterium]